MEIIGEILIELYLEMMLLIVPEKNTSKKRRMVAKIIAVCVMLILAAAVVWGIILITDYGNMWGIAPIAAAVVISLAQIIAGLVMFNRNH